LVLTGGRVPEFTGKHRQTFAAANVTESPILHVFIDLPVDHYQRACRRHCARPASAS